MSKDISVILLGAGKSSRFKSPVIKNKTLKSIKVVINHSRDFFRTNFPRSKKF